jgi:hypothetical protein
MSRSVPGVGDALELVEEPPKSDVRGRSPAGPLVVLIQYAWQNSRWGPL